MQVRLPELPPWALKAWKRRPRLPVIEMRIVLAALCGIGVLHILATLAAPYMMNTSAFARLTLALPLNKMVVLPPVTPQAQPLPFLTPDVRYAMCRYDTRNGPVSLTAKLHGRGWSLALHAPDGENIYTATGQGAQVSEVTLRIVPSTERFLGLTPEALGVVRNQEPVQTVQGSTGIAVVRAPDRGIAYAPFIEAALGEARCSVIPFQE